MKTIFNISGPVTVISIQNQNISFKSSPSKMVFTISGTGPQGPQGPPGTPAASRKFAKFIAQLSQVGPNYNLNIIQETNNTGITFNLEYVESNQAIKITDSGEVLSSGKFLIQYLPPFQFTADPGALKIFRAYDEADTIMLQAGELTLDENIHIIIESLADTFI